MQIQIETPCKATEVQERVEAAIGQVFPDAVCRVEGDVLVAEAADATHLRKRVWELRIIDTFRSALLSGQDGDVVRVSLSKQAAYGGKVRLPVGRSPLGDLDVAFTLTEEDPWDAEGFIWWLCPETEDGQIVGPTD